MVLILSSCVQEKCAKEGERIRFGDNTLPATCCGNLKALNLSYFPETCEQGIGDILGCSKCGDGICNPQTFENKCNCPEDCR